MRFSNLVAASLGAITLAEAGKSSDAILLSKVKTLTLQNGKQTSHRRVTPIPQLKCVGGNARNYGEVDVMRCRNVGSDYDVNDVQWTCEASLSEDFKLGSTEVICEGYDSPDDPYVLKGSCGVEYRLQLTEQGEMRFGVHSENTWTDTLIGFAVITFIFGVVGYGIWDNCTGGNRRGGAPRGPPYGGGWGGGYGDGDDNDPPPPYPGPGSGPHFKGPGSSASSGQGGQQQGQPGFWTGTLAGAAAGYLAGRFNGGNQQYYDQGPRWGYGSRWNRYDDGYGHRPSFGRSTTPSSSTHTSTGFGGTSRR
ncbi:putative SOCE-associated regulatory factor of calcium homoeostasis [Elsinoe australis]|uniref:Store-operated calcium entry-associated regulatory factor n=1 Tax=Elsinoe australis TaxID=40998 RepID=A0A4U7B2X6_9PEZI|nr:putative SOCE-associated regulatory factor of calcium homoeostasis [Elsinoe australis]